MIGHHVILAVSFGPLVLIGIWVVYDTIGLGGSKSNALGGCKTIWPPKTACKVLHSPPQAQNYPAKGGSVRTEIMKPAGFKPTIAYTLFYIKSDLHCLSNNVKQLSLVAFCFTKVPKGWRGVVS